jgi:peptide/nickel transport system ATP-binding protein/oligopeptide transport system ATP-binding protein
MSKPLLEVKNLWTEFRLSHRTVHAVNGVSFVLNQGDVLGIVGESGCGKSVTALSIMRLIEHPGEITQGEVLLHDGNQVLDLLKLPAKTLEKVRGDKISMIFQDPMTSLNPVLNIGFQLMEPLQIHRGMSEDEARKEAVALLDRVGIPEAPVRLKDFPHQFSGGMRQRVMIAMALACRPRLLIADEPTTALDVTIQAQIIDLINELKHETGTSVIIITHDLGVVAEMANQVAVMYAGHIVELGLVGEIYGSPQHPYTRALMGSIPRLRSWPDRLTTIEGAPPSLTDKIEGCPFKPRCIERITRCDTDRPLLLPTRPGHACACWVVQGVSEGVRAHD